MTPARGGPQPVATAADVAVDLFATHPTVALVALVVLVLAVGWVLVSVAEGVSEVAALAADAVAARWPRWATPGARYRAREARLHAEHAARSERQTAMQLATVLALARLSTRIPS